jgi:2,4-dienoyl-CoA reductase-like NADH-dependent reductase (Old Yellow Enzyme family)
VGRWFAEDGADFVHLSLGNAVGAAKYEPEAGPVATAFRKALPNGVALFAAGGIWTAEDAQRALDAGVDVVVLGKVSIGNPDWPRSMGRSGGEPIRPPWSPDHLRSVAVSDAFVGYISKFPGMVVGGAPPRG